MNRLLYVASIVFISSNLAWSASVEDFKKAVDSNDAAKVKKVYAELKGKGTDDAVRANITNYYKKHYKAWPSPAVQGQIEQKINSLQALKDLGFSLGQKAEALLSNIGASQSTQQDSSKQKKK